MAANRIKAPLAQDLERAFAAGEINQATLAMQKRALPVRERQIFQDHPWKMGSKSIFSDTPEVKEKMA